MSDIIGKNIIKLNLTDSTNNYAIKKHSQDGWPEGTVVMCKEQTNGRGQINNSWESEYGENLLLSIVLYPDFLPVQRQFQLSKIIALGISETLSLFNEEVTVKWPNDIYIGNKKIAGILIENSVMGNTICSSVIGIGINLNQKKFLSDAPNPISLFQLLGLKVDLEEFANLLFSNLNIWLNKLRNNMNHEIDYHYLKSLYRINQEAEFSDKDEIFAGKIIGINETGQLVIAKKNGGLKEYHFKEVEFI
ncbi:MAG: biotin--[acetyl-CoA-carboxylase] ligase [Prolixibacteraceae bacterium]|nr:biotin--[acetyl-CoA-carboxylase] ligase [Prolixibacteraceae bacterium]